MKWVLLLLLSAKFVWAGDLILIFPAESVGGGFPGVQPFADIEFVGDPQIEVIQENQLLRNTYKNAPAGKYRVTYGPMGPIGYCEYWMETHVTIAVGESKTVYLYQPDISRPDFPKEIIDGVSKAKENHKCYVQLEARYQGAVGEFLQYRDFGNFPKPLRLIHYLRTDASYTLKVQSFEEAKVLYEVKFRVEEPPPAEDPFGPQGKLQFKIENPAPAEKVAEPQK